MFLKEMDTQRKLALLFGFMMFSLFFALYPSHPRDYISVPETSGTSSLRNNNVLSDKLEVKDPENSDRKLFFEGLTKKDDEEEDVKNDYPVYEILQDSKSAESNVEATPEGFEQMEELVSDLTDRGTYNDEDRSEETIDSIIMGDAQFPGAWFDDERQWRSSPTIKVLAESKKVKYRLIVLEHERYYRTHPMKLYVPKLKKSARVSLDQFKQYFLDKSQPVIMPFESLRHVNFTTKARTFEELMAMYPNHAPKVYKYGMHLGENEEIDLGPAIATLAHDTDLVKTKKGRNFPRNMKVKLDSIERLDIQIPPYVPKGTGMQAPSVWFGATSSSTPTHSDCCDNFAMMITGTKRWTVAPPSESRIIKPKCQGGLCWGTKLEHADEHASTPAMRKLRDQTQLITFDLKQGEMLYLPCGWWHHVENLGPTIMVNFWTKDKPFFLQKIDGDVQ